MMRTLSAKLFIYFVIVLVISLSLVGLFSYLGSSRILDQQQATQLNQIMTTTAHQTDLYLKSYERASNVIISQDEVKRFLDIAPDNSYDYVTYADKIKKNAIQQTFLHYPHISSIYVIGSHGRYVLENNYVASAFEIDKPLDTYNKLYAQIKGNSGLTILRTSLRPEQAGSVITFARPMRGYSTFDYNGILAIEVNVRELSTLWDTLDMGAGGYFIILDPEGNLIYHPEHQQMGTSLSSSLSGPIMKSNQGTHVMKENGEQRMVVWQHASFSGWKLAVSIPMKELRRPILTIRTVVLTVGVATLIFSLWLAYRFSLSINRPLQVLREGMRRTERGVWEHISVGERRDEIGMLVQSYNVMVSRLSELIEEVYEAKLDKQRTKLILRTQQLERQRAEFQALQLQINPHFLYNTLETINCYAIIQESSEIREIVEAMAFMLRYASQTNLKEITVVNELNHIRNYMIILQHRVEREFEIDVVIPPELLLEKMVRFTLQPLIENIFEHGFKKKIEKYHSIRIDAKYEGDFFLVTVEDNGQGISPERLVELRSKLQSNKLAHEANPDLFQSGGIGLMNVHCRIQMVFGQAYGLVIESLQGQGTTIILRLPKEERDSYFETPTDT